MTFPGREVSRPASAMGIIAQVIVELVRFPSLGHREVLFLAVCRPHTLGHLPSLLREIVVYDEHSQKRDSVPSSKAALGVGSPALK